MEMSRRRFWMLLGGAWLLGAGQLGRIAKGLGDTRLVHAVRGTLFPGKVRPLDEVEMKRPAKWTG